MQITALPLPRLRQDFHVIPDGPYWHVTREHDTRRWGTALTKLEATAMGLEQARAGHVSLVVHGRDGRIQDVRSYDNWNGPDLW